jgi:hypothetical protein
MRRSPPGQVSSNDQPGSEKGLKEGVDTVF